MTGNYTDVVLLHQLHHSLALDLGCPNPYHQVLSSKVMCTIGLYFLSHLVQVCLCLLHLPVQHAHMVCMLCKARQQLLAVCLHTHGRLNYMGRGINPRMSSLAQQLEQRQPVYVCIHVFVSAYKQTFYSEGRCPMVSSDGHAYVVYWQP